MNEFMKLHLPQFPTHKTAAEHIFNLEVDLYRLRRLYEKNSPVIQIQRTWRGYFARHSAQISSKARVGAALRIQKTVRGWFLRKQLREELRNVLKETHQEYLMFTEKELTIASAADTINRAIMRYIRKKRLLAKQNKAATLIQKIARGWIARTRSFIRGLEFTKYPFFYFLREQRGLLFKVFDLIAPYLIKHKAIETSHQLRKYIYETNRYQTIRSTDPEYIRYCPLPIIQLACRPIMFGRVLLRRHKRPWPRKKPIRNSYTFRNPESLRLLKVIRQVSGRVRKKAVLKVLKRRKEKYRKLGLVEDDYNDFYIFRPPSQLILEKTCSGILQYNRLATMDQKTLLLAYFEPGLKRITSCLRLQALFRSFHIRKQKNIGFAEKVLERRAASLIQSYWRYLTLRKRLNALSSISRYLKKINSNTLYIEEWLYLNLEHIVQIHVKHTRFQQQFIYFDFYNNRVRVGYPGHPGSPTSAGFSVHPDALGILRYSLTPSACPTWLLGGGFMIPQMEEEASSISNNVSALFHCTQQFCELLPYPAIVGQKCATAGIGNQMRFVKVTYSSVDQARRRAYVVAVLSHSFISQVYVRMFTQEMLEAGFFQVNVKELWELYNIEGVQNVIEPPHLRQKAINSMYKQPHAGIILRDPRLLNEIKLDTTVYHVQGKTKRALFHCQFELSKQQKFLQHKVSSVTPEMYPSLSTAAERNNSISQDDIRYSPYPELGGSISVPIAKMQSSLTNSSQPTKNEILSSFVQLNAAKVKLQRELNRQKVATQNQNNLQEKKDAVRCRRETLQSIKQEQRQELEKNLELFHEINLTEKKMLNAMKREQSDREMELKQGLRRNVFAIKKRISFQRSNQEFCQNFSQQKNVIVKQMKIGELVQKAKQQQKCNRKMVELVRRERYHQNAKIPRKIKIPLHSQIFDTQSALFGSSMPVSRQLTRREGRGGFHQRVGSTLPPIQTPLSTIGPFDRNEVRSTEPVGTRVDRSVLSSTLESIGSPKYQNVESPVGLPPPIQFRKKVSSGQANIPSLPKLLSSQAGRRKLSDPSTMII